MNCRMKHEAIGRLYDVRQPSGRSQMLYRYHSTRPSETVLYVALDGLLHNIIVAISICL